MLKFPIVSERLAETTEGYFSAQSVYIYWTVLVTIMEAYYAQE